MATQLTQAELDELQQLLQNYEPAKEALAVLQSNEGKLESSFDQLWQEKNEPLAFAKGQQSLWEVTLTVLRDEICGNEGFRSKILDYNKNPGNAAILTGLIVYVVGLTSLPIDPALATVVVLYILKIGLNIFCKYTEPQP